MKHKLAVRIVLAATILAWAASAGAVDGTIEINQAKVMAAGGFPYKIMGSGSYRLTGNLTVSSTTADAIDVTSAATNVTIDLNGFAIIGPGGSNTGDGIQQLGSTVLTVENGSISGFSGVSSGGNGVAALYNAIVRNLQVSGNDVGIEVSSGGLVSGNTASNNVIGIYCTGSGCVISGNTTNSNSSHGIIFNESGSLITGNTVLNNGGIGLIGGDSTNGYGGNVINGNGYLNVQGGTSLGNNLCGGTVC